MDINRIELKGKISSDITYRKTKNDKLWASFTVVMREIVPQAGVDKDKSVGTWTSIAVFNESLVEYIKKMGAHKGTPVWLVGKLFAKRYEKGNYKGIYTSVIPEELVIIKTKADADEEELPDIDAMQGGNIPFDEEPF